MNNSYPIRVLCVFSSLDRGCAESMCMNLYRNMDRDKVQLDFVKHTHDKGDFEDEILRFGGCIYEAPRYKIYNYFRYRDWWVDHLNNHPEHSIIHGHFFTISAVYFKIAQSLGRITIGHSHATKFGEKNIKTILKRKSIKRVEKFSTYCLACGKEAGEWLFPNREFKVLNNAIDTKKFSYNAEARKRIQTEFGIEGKLVLGHVGRFFPQKKHLYLIDVFNEIHCRNKDSVLILVGDGELRAEVENKVRLLRLTDSVIFTGVRDDVSELMSVFDAFLLPSGWEGLPVVAIEAQANGLRCFLSDVITEEVNITGRCEFLPLDDSKLWAEGILKSDLTRVDTYEQIKKAGYDIHTTAKYLEEFYLAIDQGRLI